MLLLSSLNKFFFLLFSCVNCDDDAVHYQILTNGAVICVVENNLKILPLHICPLFLMISMPDTTLLSGKSFKYVTFYLYLDFNIQVISSTIIYLYLNNVKSYSA